MTNKVERIDDSNVITQSRWAEILFNKWVNTTIGEYQKARFSAQNRDDCILDLVNIFIDEGVSYNTVYNYAPNLIKILTTKKGRSGNADYKGWPEKIKYVYDKLLLDAYQNRALPIRVEKDESVTKIQDTLKLAPAITYKTQPTYGDDEHLEYTDVISSWAKDRFGIVYNKELDLLAHKIGHKFNIEFQSEFFDAEWVSTGKDIPKWAVDFI